MALTPFTGTIAASTLRSNFDDKTATITSNAKAGQSDFVVTVARAQLGTTAAFVTFTPPDDYELRVLRVTLQHSVAPRTVTATLTQADGDATFLLGKTISVAVTNASATRAHASLDLRTVTGDRLRLLRGVCYKLAIVADVLCDFGQASLVLRTKRRTA